MPQDPVLVINIEDNSFNWMHSIDASEGVKFGDYRYATPEEEQTSSPEKASALNRMRGVNINPPPELQTPEQRTAIRAQAKAEEEARQRGEDVEPMGVRAALGTPTVPPTAQTPPAAEQATQRSRRGE